MAEKSDLSLSRLLQGESPDWDLGKGAQGLPQRKRWEAWEEKRGESLRDQKVERGRERELGREG